MVEEGDDVVEHGRSWEAMKSSPATHTSEEEIKASKMEKPVVLAMCVFLVSCFVLMFAWQRRVLHIRSDLVLAGDMLLSSDSGGWYLVVVVVMFVVWSWLWVADQWVRNGTC